MLNDIVEVAAQYDLIIGYVTTVRCVGRFWGLRKVQKLILKIGRDFMGHKGGHRSRFRIVVTRSQMQRVDFLWFTYISCYYSLNIQFDL